MQVKLAQTALWEWFSKQGGKREKHKGAPLLEVFRANGLRGVFATKDIDASHKAPLLVVPPRMFMGTEQAEQCALAAVWKEGSTLAPPLLAAMLRSDSSAYLRLAMLLLCERAKGPKSAFHAYIQSLPSRQVPSPISCRSRLSRHW